METSDSAAAPMAFNNIPEASRNHADGKSNNDEPGTLEEARAVIAKLRAQLLAAKNSCSNDNNHSEDVTVDANGINHRNSSQAVSKDLVANLQGTVPPSQETQQPKDKDHLQPEDGQINCVQKQRKKGLPRDDTKLPKKTPKTEKAAKIKVAKVHSDGKKHCGTRRTSVKRNKISAKEKQNLYADVKSNTDANGNRTPGIWKAMEERHGVLHSSSPGVFKRANRNAKRHVQAHPDDEGKNPIDLPLSVFENQQTVACKEKARLVKEALDAMTDDKKRTYNEMAYNLALIEIVVTPETLRNYKHKGLIDPPTGPGRCGRPKGFKLAPRKRRGRKPKAQKDNQGSQNQALCKTYLPLPNDVSGSDLQDILHGLGHSILTSHFKNEIAKSDHPWPVAPLFPAWDSDRDGKSHLLNEPLLVINESELCTISSVIDLCTEWTFRGGMHLKSSMYVTPALLFQKLATIPIDDFDETKERYEEWSQRVAITRKQRVHELLRQSIHPQLLSQGDGNFFSKKVVDVTIYDSFHFSKAFIIDAGAVLKKVNENDLTTMDAKPCIIYCNSSKNFSNHSLQVVGPRLHKMLNGVEEIIFGSERRSFDRKSLPVHQFNVPKQTDDFSSAFQTLIMRDCVLQALEESGNKFNNNGSDDSFHLAAGHSMLSYDPDWALFLRSELRFVVTNLCTISPTIRYRLRQNAEELERLVESFAGGHDNPVEIQDDSDNNNELERQAASVSGGHDNPIEIEESDTESSEHEKDDPALVGKRKHGSEVATANKKTKI